MRAEDPGPLPSPDFIDFAAPSLLLAWKIWYLRPLPLCPPAPCPCAFFRYGETEEQQTKACFSGCCPAIRAGAIAGWC